MSGMWNIIFVKSEDTLCFYCYRGKHKFIVMSTLYFFLNIKIYMFVHLSA